MVALGRLERDVHAGLARERARPGAGGEHDPPGDHRPGGGVERRDAPVRAPQPQQLHAGADVGAVLDRGIEQRADERAGIAVRVAGLWSAPAMPGASAGSSSRASAASRTARPRPARGRALEALPDSKTLSVPRRANPVASRRGRAPRAAQAGARKRAQHSGRARGAGRQRGGAEAREPRQQAGPQRSRNGLSRRAIQPSPSRTAPRLASASAWLGQISPALPYEQPVASPLRSSTVTRARGARARMRWPRRSRRRRRPRHRASLTSQA